MSALPKKLIQENDIKNPAKDAFKDVLQKMLEAEMDVSLGYSTEDSRQKPQTTVGMATLQNG